MVVVSLLIVTPIVGFCNCSMFCCVLPCIYLQFCNHLDGEDRAGYFALFVSLVSRVRCVSQEKKSEKSNKYRHFVKKRV